MMVTHMGLECDMEEMMKDNQTFEIDIDNVVRRYADMVYRLAVLNTKNRFEAEDAFQEVFLKLYRNRHKIKDEEHLKAWLIRVTVNQCRSMAVSAWNKHTVSLETTEEIAQTPETEDYSAVYEAVRKLPEKYREVIYLYYYEELSVKEIAKLLNKREATVKTQLARGRKLLNQQLKGEFGDGRF